jgi:hypothetical protein
MWLRQTIIKKAMPYFSMQALMQISTPCADEIFEDPAKAVDLLM